MTTKPSKNVSGVVRALAVTVAAAAIAVGASRTTGSVQLAAPHERAGLPESSNVLVDQAGLVCPGQQRLGAEGLRDVQGTVTAGAVAAPPGVLAKAGSAGRGAPASAGSTAGSVTLESGATSAPVAAGTAAGSVVSAGVSNADVVIATAVGALAPGLAATQVWQHTGDDDRGLAVTPCQLSSSDVWLVGGGAGASRTERVVVSNPGANAVSVSFDVFGRTGPVTAAEGRSVSVPPLSRAVVSLDAIAPNEPSPAVHVVATGGVISAVLDEQWIQGATGRGIDDSTRAAAPATDLVIGGLDVGGSTWARVVNPGDVEALVKVRLLSDKGAVQPDGLRAVRVAAGSTADILVPVTSGVLGLGLTADHPVVAAGWTERRATTGDKMGDFAWVPATPALRGIAGVVLPGLSAPATTKRLVLTAGATGGRVDVHLGSGADVRVVPTAIGPDTTTALDLGAADRVWVTAASGDVRGAVSVLGVDAGVPLFSIAALSNAPVTALAIPVRQVGN